MNEKVFSYIWKNVVKQVIEEQYNQISLEDKTKYGVRIVLPDEQRFFRSYTEYHDIVKEIYFERSPKNLIDFHKVSACIAGAMIDNQAIHYKMVRDIPQEVYLSNYLIVFYVGIRCQYLLTLSGFKIKGELERFKLLEDKEGFVLPVTNPGHDRYDYGRAKQLALNDGVMNRIKKYKDKVKTGFDILSFADMLFWIEKYNLSLLNNSK